MKRAVAVAAAMLAAGLAFSQDKPPAVAGQVCAACHAADGNSVAAANPKIAGQYAEYISTQLTAFREGKRTNDVNGVMRGVAAHMNDGQIRAVAEYAAGLR